MLLIEGTPESVSLARLRVEHGDVVLAGARCFQPCVVEGSQQRDSVVDQAQLHLLAEVSGDRLRGVGHSVQALAQADSAFQRLMFWLHKPLAPGIVRPGPALGVVPVVPPMIEHGMDGSATVGLDRAGWGDVERLAGGQLDARYHEMQFYPVAVRVFHPEDVVLLR
jgi:hypothetical protein